MAHGQIYYDQIRSGGVSLKGGNYTIFESDAFSLIAFNPLSSPLTTYTATLPASPGTLRRATWWVAISNYGGGIVTVSPNGNNIDGAAGSITLTANQSVLVQTDGTNYFTQRGMGAGGGGLTSPLTTKGDIWGYSSTNARIPVGSNGQVLVADSAQTLGVRWGAAGGGSGGALTQLGQVTTSGSQTSVSFASISAAYTDLILTYACRTTAAVSTTALRMEINGDTTAADYDATQYLLAITTTPVSGTVASSTIGGFVNNVPGTSATANYPSTGRVTIESYSKTTFYKRWHHEGGYAQSGAGGNDVVLLETGIWQSTAAINALLLQLDSSDAFVDGSVFTLYASS